jgi:hypothetical protein
MNSSSASTVGAPGMQHSDPSSASPLRTSLSLTTSPDIACVEVLLVACQELRDPQCKWLGLLPVPRGSVLPRTMFTHLPALDFARKYSNGPINLRSPPRRVRFGRPYKMDPGGPICRFLWLTFPTSTINLPDDPTILVHELGLAHYKPGNYIYRVRYDVNRSALWIPTCLDAELYEAWAPPDRNHAAPWGLTRHLTTGLSCLPEMLSEVVYHQHILPRADLVSPPGSAKPIAAFTPDYIANRP